MTSIRHRLLAATSALALAASFQAHAFEPSAWNWSVTVDETATSTVTSTLDALPNGAVALDKLQLNVGNPSAEASGSATVTPPAGVDPVDAMTDLGRLSVSAGAYGNVDSAESEVPLTARVGQFSVGGIDPTAAVDGSVVTVDPTATAANPNQAVMQQLMDSAATGMVTPHQTAATADGTVSGLGADVEARAISNSSSLTLAAREPAALESATGETYPLATDAIMAGEVTQFSLGDTQSRTTVTQTLDGMSNLGAIGQPTATSVATSIGNLSTVKVTASGPAVDASPLP